MNRQGAKNAKSVGSEPSAGLDVLEGAIETSRFFDKKSNGSFQLNQCFGVLGALAVHLRPGSAAYLCHFRAGS
ncbi:MAG: hypothetical protein ABI488_16695 [Polyangiaceae bacterium]